MTEPEFGTICVALLLTTPLEFELGEATVVFAITGVCPPINNIITDQRWTPTRLFALSRQCEKRLLYSLIRGKLHVRLEKMGRPR